MGPDSEVQVSGDDPIFYARRFLTMRDRPGFPKCYINALETLERRESSMAKGDVGGWVSFYEDLLDIAQDVVVRLESELLPEVAGNAANACRARDGGDDPFKLIDRYLPEIKVCDTEAVDYVIDHRVIKQRDTEIRRALDSFVDGLAFSDRIDDGELVVEVPDAVQNAINGGVEAVFSQWKEKVLTSTVSRIQKRRDPILAMIHSSLCDLDLQFPDVATVRPGLVAPFRIPSNCRCRISSLPESVWLFFRSKLGIVFMAASLAAGVFFGTARSMNGRFQIIIWAVPVLLAVALIQSFRNRQIERRRKRKELEADLYKKIQKKLEESAEAAGRDIQATLRKLKAENKDRLKIWWFNVERHASTTKPMRVKPGMDIEVSGPGVVSSSQVRSLISQIQERIIPALTTRVDELRP